MLVSPADVGKTVCIRNEELFVNDVSRAAHWSTTVRDLAGTITAVEDGCMKIDGREVELPVSNHRTVRVQFATLDSLFYILAPSRNTKVHQGEITIPSHNCLRLILHSRLL